MCQAIPRKVVQVEPSRAEVLVDGRLMWVVALGLPELRPGDYVIVHAGQALERIDAATAEALLQELTDLDAMFNELMPQTVSDDG